MTLPVRVGVRVTRFALNTTLTTSARAMSLAGGALQSLAGRSDVARPEPPSAPLPERPRPAAAAPAPVAPVAPVADMRPTPTAQEPEPVDEPEPAHVSEEPELVAEVSEPGAEDGAGAAVRVDEPWDGYARLKAEDVVDHLATADSAELAAIQLYENAHKRRETVLTAVARELRKG